MPRLFVPSAELGGERITLGGESHRYLTRVLRFGVGARVDLFDGQGLEVAAEIVKAGSREITLQLGERRRAPPRSTPPVTLLQGLPRPERMDLVIQKATELGAARVIPVRAARSAGGQQPRPDRWEKIAREAARQCGRADALIISPVASLAEALSTLQAATTRLVPWEEAPGALPLGQALQRTTEGGQPEGDRASARVRGGEALHPGIGMGMGMGVGVGVGVDVLIGPEGGLTAEEVGLAEEVGFRVVGLGPRILRTETAAIAVLAVIQNHLGALG